MKTSIVILAVCAAVLSVRAASNPGPGANTVITIRQGTNVVETVIPGTNAVVTITPGTNAVMTVAPGANGVLALHTNAIPKAQPPQWASLVAAGLSLTRGNSDTTLLTAKAQTQKKDERNEWFLEADGAYGMNNSVESQDSLHGLGQHNHLFTDKFYGYGNLDALHDGIQDLTYRVSLSPGAGYYFIKTKATTLSLEAGPGVLTEERGDGNDTYMSLRIAEHWDQKLSQTAKLWEKVEILPEVTKWENYSANMECGVDTALTKRLSLQVTFDDSFVNEPAPGRKSNDVKLVSGIAWKF